MIPVLASVCPWVENVATLSREPDIATGEILEYFRLVPLKHIKTKF